MRADTYQAVLYDIACSLIHNGFSKIVFATGHTSNTKVVDRDAPFITQTVHLFASSGTTRKVRQPSSMTSSRTRPRRPRAGTGARSRPREVMAFNPKLARLDRTKKDFAHRPKWMEAAGATSSRGITAAPTSS